MCDQQLQHRLRFKPYAAKLHSLDFKKILKRQVLLKEANEDAYTWKVKQDFSFGKDSDHLHKPKAS